MRLADLHQSLDSFVHMVIREEHIALGSAQASLQHTIRWGTVSVGTWVLGRAEIFSYVQDDAPSHH